MKIRILIWTLSLAAAFVISAPVRVYAHCDTLDGPVVVDAKTALEQGDVTPVLKWVKAQDEAEIRALFDQALAVRKKDPQSRQLADMYFFETLVRIHRAGEGYPYTGLKSAGADLEPGIAEADRALASASADALASKAADEVREGILHRFQKVQETRKNAANSVKEGREYVEAYVTFIHYVERLHQDIHSQPHHQAETAAEPEHRH